MDLRKAQRREAKTKLALQGPCGSGKTKSALLLASEITDLKSWQCRKLDYRNRKH